MRTSHARYCAEGAIALMPARTSGNLRHLRWSQPTFADPVKLGKRGKGNVMQVEIEPHSDRIGGNDIINLTILEQFNLLVARFR